MAQLGGMNHSSPSFKAFQGTQIHIIATVRRDLKDHLGILVAMSLSAWWGQSRLNTWNVNFPKEDKQMVLSTKRQGAAPEAIQLPSTWELGSSWRLHSRVSHSTVLCTGSSGAAQGNESFSEGIQPDRAPSCPLPLLCSQIMQKVGVWRSMRELGTQLPSRKNCQKRTDYLRCHVK